MIRVWLVMLVATLSSGAAWAQGGSDVAGTVSPREPVEVGRRNDFRTLGGYPFQDLSSTVRDMQNLAYAMQLRDYCADARLPDEFVRVQLARFSLITAREENCRTLLDY